MTLHLTRDEWDRIDADGEGVLFRSAHNRLGPDGKFDWLAPHEFVEAAQPCETCLGDGWWWCDIDSDEHIRQRCGSCIDGKRRIAAAVPCGNCARGGGDHPTRSNLECPCLDGLVTVGHVVVTWGPAIVVLDQEEVGSAYEGPACVEINPTTGYARYWPAWSGALEYEDGIELTLPPDVDPQSLVGQYAIGIKVVDQ